MPKNRGSSSRLDGADMEVESRLRKIEDGDPNDLPESMKRRSGSGGKKSGKKSKRRVTIDESGPPSHQYINMDSMAENDPDSGDGNGGQSGGDGQPAVRNHRKNALDPNGEVPEWMKRQGIGSIAPIADDLVKSRGSFDSELPQRPGMEAQRLQATDPPIGRHPRMQRSGGYAGNQPVSAPSQSAATSTSEVNIINQTDANLRLVAVDQAGSGKKVETHLLPKQGNVFVAPMGCALSILHPDTGKAVLRYKVVDPQTTLVVTDAQLNNAGNLVGGSGKWYDNRVFLAIAGAIGVCVLLGLAAGAAFLIHFLAKRYSTSGGVSTSVAVRRPSVAKARWNKFK